MTTLPPGLDLVTTNGVFSLGEHHFELVNNVWLVGDQDEVVVIDASHDHRPIAAAVDGRKVVAIILTHGHNDHLNAAVALREAVSAPVHLHPADRMLWDSTHPRSAPDAELADGLVFKVAGSTLEVLHTPGHTPGSCSLLWRRGAHDEGEEPLVVFSGDTLFPGGPGATGGRPYSDEATILRSIKERLLVLPAATQVLPGHGEGTTIADEAPGVLELVRAKG